MFDRQRRNFRTPVREFNPVRVGTRVNVIIAGMIEVRPEVMLEEARPLGSLQSVPEQVDCTAIQILISLDDREHVAARQHRAVEPTRTRLGLVEIPSTVRVIIDRGDHCSGF